MNTVINYGGVIMFRKKSYGVAVSLSSDEARLAVTALNSFRNHVLEIGKPTEDIDSLIMTIIRSFG